MSVHSHRNMSAIYLSLPVLCFRLVVLLLQSRLLGSFVDANDS